MEKSELNNNPLMTIVRKQGRGLAGTAVYILSVDA